jgi:hypothetical protein
VTIADAEGSGAVEAPVVATAVSARRTVMVEVDASGFVSGVKLLSDDVRHWDSRTIDQRTTAVAAVAHNRYLANLQSSEASYPSLDEVADDERKLAF